MRLFLSTVIILISSAVKAQQIPLNQSVQNRFNSLTLQSDSSIFTGFRSSNWLEFNQSEVRNKTALADSAFGINTSGSHGYFLNHPATDNWIKAIGKNSVFTIDPYLDATFGKSNRSDGVLTTLAAGIRTQAVFNNKFSFNLDLITNSSQFPMYVDSVIALKNNIIPGANAASVRNNRFNYSYLNFNATFTPSKYFLISAGYGKQFIGDGYRSLLLSDNAFNYPYVRLQARLWKFTYNVLYNRYINKNWYMVNGQSQPKYSTIHYLGVNFSKRFQLGLFDNVTWLAKDTNFNRGFDVQYLNPIIFLRPVEFSIGSPDNAMVGLTWKYKLYTKGFLYGQIALDDINLRRSLDNHAQHYGNKYALQAGIWNQDIFGIQGLDYRFEWNGVRPYEYGHGVGGNISLNYTHYYQPLTDPFGANFHEFISYFNYTNKRWYGILENLYTIRGENPGLPYNNGEDLWGGERGVPAFGSKTLQGIRHKYSYNQLSIGYLINPANRLSLQADVIYRSNKAQATNQSEFYFSFGIKTNIFNFYHDF